jgi:pimeloyl-ACP methyl ester carboxylesterase
VYRGLTGKRSLRWWGRREGYEDASRLDERVISYQHRTARQDGARYAPASFIAGYLTPEFSLEETISTLEIPVTLVWGREATRPPLAVGRRYEAISDATLLVVDETRLLPHAERPAAFLGALRRSGSFDRLEPEEPTTVRD